MVTNRFVKIIKFAVFPAALCFSTLAMAVNVDLKVDTSVNPPVIVVSGNNAQCSGGPIDCIEVKARSQPHMYFKLANACRGVDYRLTKFRIAEQDKKWATAAKPMTADVAKDFCADRKDGYVHFNYCNNQLKDDMMKLKNFNKKKVDLFYEITAEHCTDPGKKIYLDPAIKNRGEN
jgi:hypothetical protein